MNCAAAVLFHNHTSVGAVDYVPVTDALLSGGVFLRGVTLLPYDDPALSSELGRLAAANEGVLLICDEVLLPTAQKLLGELAKAPMEGPLLETESHLFAALPTGMGGAKLVSEQLIPCIDKRRGNSYFRMIFRTVGAPSQVLSGALEAAKAPDGEYELHVTEKYGAARIELIYDKATSKFSADEAARTFATLLEPYLYALEDVSIAERLVQALKLRRRRISVAESFTGGGVGRAIVSVPGASEVYFEGLNTYNAASKIGRLGVAEATVAKCGTVSENTAYEMAAGLLATGNCDLAVATTGVAGPDPDEKGNPPGLLYIAVGTASEIGLFCYHLAGDRTTVTETAINLALFLAYRELR